MLEGSGVETQRLLNLSLHLVKLIYFILLTLLRMGTFLLHFFRLGPKVQIP
jgi:hypothetical protein